MLATRVCFAIGFLGARRLDREEIEVDELYDVSTTYCWEKKRLTYSSGVLLQD